MQKQKNLVEIQTLMQKAVQKGSYSFSLLKEVVEKPPLSTNVRVKIYQDAYRVRLLESLRDDFSRVEEFIGASEFEELALIFISNTPSCFRNLAEYSRAFPDFIKIQSPQSYDFALKDWMEILSIQAFEPDSLMSLEDLQNGKPFTVRTHPSSILQCSGDRNLLSYRHKGEVLFIEIKNEFIKIFKILKVEKTLEDIVAFAEAQNLQQDPLLNTITSWIEMGIIYCKPLMTKSQN